MTGLFGTNELAVDGVEVVGEDVELRASRSHDDGVFCDYDGCQRVRCVESREVYSRGCRRTIY